MTLAALLIAAAALAALGVTLWRQLDRDLQRLWDGHPDELHELGWRR